MDVETIRADFPILNERVNGHPLVYLDSAASSQKPRSVINALLEYYRRDNANIHRGLHTLAERATGAYEHTRTHIAKFINADEPEEIVLTRGTTEAINLLAYTWGEQNIGEGDEIVVTEMEHHANFVPWYQLAQRKGAIIRRIPITVCGHLDLSDIDTIINSRTKLVTVVHMSNVLGTINPIAEIAAKAKKHGAIVVSDGAQAAPAMPIDVKDLGVDFYAFSSHKMLGPTGVGVLYGKRHLLEAMPPFNFGGEMIQEVRFDKVTWAELPHKFEAGTPNIADVVAFDAALHYLEDLGMENIHRYERDLTAYAIERLSELPGLEIQGPRETEQRGAAVSFTDPDIHPHDISTFLDSHGIAIRAGHHCAQPLMRVLGKVATARASFYVYNDRSEVDTLVEALKDMRKYFCL
ncbi:MAG: cysteine desulfurase [candidate division Zixibacteria bacterium]|nr:cysteine desulfurase [candidate division Zixibacteria bacterium]